LPTERAALAAAFGIDIDQLQVEIPRDTILESQRSRKRECDAENQPDRLDVRSAQNFADPPRNIKGEPGYRAFGHGSPFYGRGLEYGERQFVDQLRCKPRDNQTGPNGESPMMWLAILYLASVAVFLEAVARAPLKGELYDLDYAPQDQSGPKGCQQKA
jgi:hypothetical protein